MELGDTSVRSILYSCEIYRGSGASRGCKNYGGRDRNYENDDGKQFKCTHRRMITLWRAVAFFDGLERGRKQKKQNGDRKCHHCRIQGYLNRIVGIMDAPERNAIRFKRTIAKTTIPRILQHLPWLWRAELSPEARAHMTTRRGRCPNPCCPIGRGSGASLKVLIVLTAPSVGGWTLFDHACALWLDVVYFVTVSSPS